MNCLPVELISRSVTTQQRAFNDFKFELTCIQQCFSFYRNVLVFMAHGTKVNVDQANHSFHSEPCLPLKLSTSCRAKAPTLLSVELEFETYSKTP